MDDHRGSKWLQIISAVFIAGILAFLALSGITTILKEPSFSSYYENRSLAALPEPSKAGILDGSYFYAIDHYLQEHAAGRNTILRLETLLDMKLLHRPVVNDVVIRKDVLVAWQDFWIYDRDWLTTQAEETAERIAGHARTAKEYGGNFYYIAVPHQALAFPEAYPSYLQSHEDYYRDISDALFSALEKRNVSCLDMWEIFRSEGILKDVSSRIDNHFGILGTLEICSRLIQRVNEDTGLTLKSFAGDENRIEWLPNHYIGSRTRKLFDLWPSGEQLGIIPMEDGLTFERRDTASWLAEPRESSSIYDLPATPEDPVSYSLYMGGDWGSTIITTKRPDLPSILVYGDSFTNAVECLIWQRFDTMYAFDFRHYSDCTIDELIALYQPEVVICIRDYEALLKNDGNGR